MGVILDTSVLIAAERGVVNLEELTARIGEQEVALASITASELLHGVARAKPPQFQEKRQRYVEEILRDITVVGFGLEEARTHAVLWVRLQAAGTPIGGNDMLIAATALRLGFSVATLNEREFCRVPNLQLFPVIR